MHRNPQLQPGRVDRQLSPVSRQVRPGQGRGDRPQREPLRPVRRALHHLDGELEQLSGWHEIQDRRRRVAVLGDPGLQAALSLQQRETSRPLADPGHQRRSPLRGEARAGEMQAVDPEVETAADLTGASASATPPGNLPPSLRRSADDTSSGSGAVPACVTSALPGPRTAPRAQPNRAGRQEPFGQVRQLNSMPSSSSGKVTLSAASDPRVVHR
jgi:hypothetical protein